MNRLNRTAARARALGVSLAVAMALLSGPRFAAHAAGKAADRAQVSGPTLDPALGIATTPLWGGPPPGWPAGSNDPVPTLTLFAPQPGKGNGTAVIIAPGGAYLGLASNLEGRQVADWFTSKGIIAVVLRYRLGQKNLYPVPLRDAQRAVRVVRSWGAARGVSVTRVGIVGFSAGGHLAAMTSIENDDGDTGATDAVERVSDRPDFVVLGYPWLNAMQLRDPKVLNYCTIMVTITAEQCAAYEQNYTPSLKVTSRTPPTFIYGTTDDSTVPVSALIEYYAALSKAGVSAEMHLFAHGGHGSGMGAGDAALDVWPALLEQWLRDQGYLAPDESVSAAQAAALPVR